jgi:glycosyltransferase involved in cell wall biosynthesis
MHSQYNVLFIAPDFPPLNKVSSLRPYYMARAFAEHGWGVHVLCEISDDVLNDLSRPEDGLKVHRVRCRNRPLWSAFAAGKLLSLKLSGIRFDVILSTHGPSSSHVLGHLANRLWPGSSWIADYRDPWKSANYYSGRRPGFYNRSVAWFERNLLRRAVICTTTSKGLQANLQEFHSKPCEVIYNGYEAIGDASGRDVDDLDKKIRIVYTGLIYGPRNPVPLLEALARHPTAKGKIEVVIAGKVEPDILQSFDPFIAAGVLRYVGEVSRAEAYELQRLADCGLLIEFGLASKLGMLPVKIFEYFAAAKPIITMGVATNSEVVEIVRESGLLFWASEENADLDRCLTELVEGRFRALHPNVAFIAQFKRHVQCQRVVTLAQSLLLEPRR